MIPANIASMHILNWWASRSKANLNRRIGDLKLQLIRAQTLPELNPTEDAILKASQGLAGLLVIVFVLMATSMAGRPVMDRIFIGGMSLIGIIAAVGLSGQKVSRAAF